MKIVKPKYEIVDQKYNDLLNDMFRHIEICGRTCYKSEDKITDTSYEKFVNRMVESEHGAMLEHGTVYLTIPLGTPVDDPQYMKKYDIISFFSDDKYSVVKKKTVNESVTIDIKGYGIQKQASADFYYITSNWRVIYNHDDKDAIVEWMTAPTEDHEKRYTVIFTYNLAAARDVNRHRVQSIAEESTRYCNYSKDKFGQELNIVEPIWFTPLAKNRINSENQWSLKTMCRLIAQGRENEMDSIDMWRFVNLACEFGYMYNTNNYRWTPQHASLMLPLDTKTSSVHTAFVKDWCHFFNLRALGTTGAPRPSVKEVAWPLMEEFLDKGYITIDMIDKDHYEEIKSKYPNIKDYISI